jgi:cellulose synthase/poly-beta-1,6-N-acetylglucosamine synthase-like glycosyltransferase
MIAEIVVGLMILVLAYNAAYLFIFSVAGALRQPGVPKSKQSEYAPNFLVLLPGFKEDSVIIKSAESVLAQNYPSENFKCVVLADCFKPETVAALRTRGVEVFEVPDDPNRNKAKSIQLYLSNCFTEYNACVILDADNVIQPDFLQVAASYIANGSKIIQARRVAKNEENVLSRMDSLSEVINNHIFRKGQRALGLSASLIGSGMIIDMNTFRMVMEDMDVFSGFDKEMELRLLKNRFTMEYAESIVVYDEKVSQHQVYVNQRRRWTYAQIHFLKKNIFRAFYELISHRNFDYFNKVVQFSLLPRIVTIGLSLILIPATFFLEANYFIASSIIFAMVSSSILIASRKHIRFSEILKLTMGMPAVFFGMIKALVTSGQAARKFIHTPHNAQ